MQKRLGLDLEVPDVFGIGLAWYTVGEAHFLATTHKDKSGYRQLVLRYQIGLRDDDRPGLEYIRDTLGVGHIHNVPKQRKTWNPGAMYKVSAIADLYHIIIPLFEKYPLPRQWRKAREFDIWKRLVEIKYHQGRPRALGAPGGKRLGFAPLPRSFWDKVLPLIEELNKVRAYHPPS